jgi:hypothetical protein
MELLGVLFALLEDVVIGYLEVRVVALLGVELLLLEETITLFEVVLEFLEIVLLNVNVLLLDEEKRLGEDVFTVELDNDKETRSVDFF